MEETKEELFDLNNLLLEGDEGENLEDGDDFNPFAEEAETEEEEFENNEENEEESEEESLENSKKKKVAEGKKKPSSENVGNDEEEQESAAFPNNDGTSPKNIYSSIAKVLKEEGTFPDLTKEDLESIEDSDTFINVIQNQIRNSIDEEYQGIKAALNVGVKPDAINSYRNSIKYLDGITEEMIKDENNENLRKTLILQDMVNRGYSKERAEKTQQKSLDRGDDDVEDALEALEANKEFFNQKYTELLNNAKEQEKAAIEEQKQRTQEFKKSIMEDKNLYGDFEVNQQMRQQIYDSLTKPVYTDKKSGQTYTAVQKWELDDPDAFNKVLGLMYQLTNGGKDFKNLIKGEVKKKVSKARSEFENAIRNSSSNMDGGRIRLANAHDTDNESFLKGFTLDV